jgi:hypothetical protein
MMELAALHWSQFLPGQLLYTCSDLRAFALQLKSTSRPPSDALKVRTMEHEQNGQAFGDDSQSQTQTRHPQPQLVVIPAGMSQTGCQANCSAVPSGQATGDSPRVCIHCCMLLHSSCKKLHVALILCAVNELMNWCRA